MGIETHFKNAYQSKAGGKEYGEYGLSASALYKAGYVDIK